MNAFNAKTKIARKVADPATDHTLPGRRSLSWKTIAAPVALAGTKGSHCELVHGDQWNELKGNHTKNIAKNQTLKVVGKHKETLVESCYQNIIGPQIVLNNTVRNETRLGAFTLVYGGAQNQQTKDGESWTKPFDAQWVDYVAFEYDTTKLEVMGAHGEAVGVHGEAVACHAEYKVFHTEITDIHNSVVAGKNEATEAANEAAAVDNRITALEIESLLSRSGNHAIEQIDTDVLMSLKVAETHIGNQVYVGPESHTGPAAFAAITGPGIL